MADLSKDTLLFSREFGRMCSNFENCENCRLHGHPCTFGRHIYTVEDDERILQCVQQWHDEHPPKTYAQDFREKFPNCTWSDDANSPRGLCKNRVYYNEPACDYYGTCEECWNKPMPEDNNA